MSITTILFHAFRHSYQTCNKVQGKSTREMGKAAEAAGGVSQAVHPDTEGQGGRGAGTTSSAEHNGKHLQERVH